MEIHRLTARLRVLRRFGLDLCLGRIVGADDPEPVYVGRLGLPTARAAGCWSTGAPRPLSRSSGRPTPTRWAWPAAAGTAGPAAGSATTGRRCSPRTGWTGTRRSTTSRRSSPAWAAAGRPDARRARHDPGRPGRHHPGRVARGSRRRRQPGTGKTVVALHRSAYLLYPDPRLGHRRGGVLFVGPHQPYLAYVSDVLPSLGEDGVQTCTLRDLVAEGAAAAAEPDPEVARLKSSADLVGRSSRPSGSTRSRPPRGWRSRPPGPTSG